MLKELKMKGRSRKRSKMSHKVNKEKATNLTFELLQRLSGRPELVLKDGHPVLLLPVRVLGIPEDDDGAGDDDDNGLCLQPGHHINTVQRHLTVAPTNRLQTFARAAAVRLVSFIGS